MSDIALNNTGERGARAVRIVPRERPFIGPVPLLMMGGLALSSLVMAAYGSWAGLGAPKFTSSPEIESRELSFQPVGEQGFDAIDPASGRRVAELRLAKGDGFLIQVIRGLNHDRKVAGRDLASPYRLKRHADGSSYMVDAASGKFIATASFGAAQAAHVTKLIEKAGVAAGGRT
jgi:putative photosynthetic complex assembly protein